MPLGKLEGDILRLLAVNRNPESHVAGGSVLNQSEETSRSSQDIDLFHDTRIALESALEKDVKVLQAHGYEVSILLDSETFKRASVRKDEQGTKIEWVFDSAFRFYPTEPDEALGYRLNYWDAATNKVLAAAGRNVIRDYVDLLEIHQNHLSLGALVWAAAGKDDGLSPSFILEEMSRVQRYSKIEYDEVTWTQPFDRKAMKQVWITALNEGRQLVNETLLEAPYGCLFLDEGGTPVTPTAENWSDLKPHYGSVRGCWPRISEVD